MATGSEGQPLNELKLTRSAAQTTFTRKANLLDTEAKRLNARELFDCWKDLKEDFTRVSNAGSDYAAALRETEEEEAVKKAEEIDKKTAAGYNKLLAVKETVQELLTPSMKREIFTHVEGSDSAMSQAEDIDVKQMTLEECDLLDKNLAREILAVEKIVRKWSEMISNSEELELIERIELLHERHETLRDRLTAHKDREQKTIPPVVMKELKVEYNEKLKEYRLRQRQKGG